ncbi:hypothetical protein QYF61_017847 [Mycteria americana]|uniref:Uncharacterized protein n=1 Tax=Mycteria americana TaxID=33587 RepID=A0AAN7S3T3_MYCAM|nr:hypothetical protein QYF61_017847 [Mycteria americana]
MQKTTICVGEDSSHSSPAPAWVPHGRQSSTNFSSVRPSHRLQFFMNCSSVGCSPSGTDCSSVGPPQGHKPCQQTCSSVGSSLSMGHRSCQEPAPAWASHGVTASFGCIHLLRYGVLNGLQVDICSTMDLHGLEVDICSTMDLHGLQGDSLPHHGLHHGLQGNLCSEVELQAKYTAAAVVTRYAETVPGAVLEELVLQDNSTTAPGHSQDRLGVRALRPLAVLMSLTGIPGLPPSLPRAPCQPLPQPCLSRAALQLPAALPGLATGPLSQAHPQAQGRAWLSPIPREVPDAWGCPRAHSPAELAWKSNSWEGNALASGLPLGPVPILDDTCGEEIFPNIQSKTPLVQLEAISSWSITSYLGEETDPHLSTTSPQVVVESDKVSPQPPFLQAKQPQFPQPLLIRLVLQTLHQLRCPSLDTLQPLNVSLVVGGPKLNTLFEVWPHQCQVQGHNHFPSPAGHTIFDTSQDAIGFLGHLGTLLAHVQLAPVGLHGVVVAQVEDLALGLVEPHTIGLGPSIQPVQIPPYNLPLLKQINTPAQLGVICKLTEGALDPFIHIVDKDIKQNWPQY